MKFKDTGGNVYGLKLEKHSLSIVKTTLGRKNCTFKCIESKEGSKQVIPKVLEPNNQKISQLIEANSIENTKLNEHCVSFNKENKIHLRNESFPNDKHFKIPKNLVKGNKQCLDRKSNHSPIIRRSPRKHNSIETSKYLSDRYRCSRFDIKDKKLKRNENYHKKLEGEKHCGKRKSNSSLSPGERKQCTRSEKMPFKYDHERSYNTRSKNAKRTTPNRTPLKGNNDKQNKSRLTAESKKSCSNKLPNKSRLTMETTNFKLIKGNLKLMEECCQEKEEGEISSDSDKETESVIQTLKENKQIVLDNNKSEFFKSKAKIFKDSDKKTQLALNNEEKRGLQHKKKDSSSSVIAENRFEILMKKTENDLTGKICCDKSEYNFDKHKYKSCNESAVEKKGSGNISSNGQQENVTNNKVFENAISPKNRDDLQLRRESSASISEDTIDKILLAHRPKSVEAIINFSDDSEMSLLQFIEKKPQIDCHHSALKGRHDINLHSPTRNDDSLPMLPSQIKPSKFVSPLTTCCSPIPVATPLNGSSSVITSSCTPTHFQLCDITNVGLKASTPIVSFDLDRKINRASCSSTSHLAPNANTSLKKRRVTFETLSTSVHGSNFDKKLNSLDKDYGVVSLFNRTLDQIEDSYIGFPQLSSPPSQKVNKITVPNNIDNGALICNEESYDFNLIRRIEDEKQNEEKMELFALPSTNNKDEHIIEQIVIPKELILKKKNVTLSSSSVSKISINETDQETNSCPTPTPPHENLVCVKSISLDDTKCAVKLVNDNNIVSKLVEKSTIDNHNDKSNLNVTVVLKRRKRRNIVLSPSNVNTLTISSYC